MIGWKKLLSLLLAAALSLNLSPFALAAEDGEEKVPGPELPGLQDLREAGYDGSGIVIAVLDSGLGGMTAPTPAGTQSGLSSLGRAWI